MTPTRQNGTHTAASLGSDRRRLNFRLGAVVDFVIIAAVVFTVVKFIMKEKSRQRRSDVYLYLLSYFYTMGKGALVMGFLPALVAGLLMGYFLNAFPDAGSGRVGDKVEKVEYASPLMEALDKFLMPAFFIVMILFALKAIFNIGLLGLVSALLGYAGMLMIMSGAELFGLLYLLFGGMLCLASAD